MDRDIFIASAPEDRKHAELIGTTLEKAGLNCRLVKDDGKTSGDYAKGMPSIKAESKVLVIVFSGHANNSQELARILADAMETGMAVIPFRIEAVEPKGVMLFYLSDTQWLDADNPPTAKQLQILVETARSLLEHGTEQHYFPADQVASKGGLSNQKKVFMLLAAVSFGALLYSTTVYFSGLLRLVNSFAALLSSL